MVVERIEPEREMIVVAVHLAVALKHRGDEPRGIARVYLEADVKSGCIERDADRHGECGGFAETGLTLDK